VKFSNAYYGIWYNVDGCFEEILKKIVGDKSLRALIG